MDEYSEWKAQDLRDECVRRGLGTARSRVDLVSKLREDDKKSPSEPQEPVSEVAEPVEDSEPAPVAPEAVEAAQPDPEADVESWLVAPNRMRVSFRFDGILDDATLIRFRERVYHIAASQCSDVRGGLNGAQYRGAQGGRINFEIGVRVA